MPNPKRQHSKQRSRKRTTHYKTKLPTLTKCSHCQKSKAQHRVCPFCGFYKGKKVLDLIKKTEKKQKKAKAKIAAK